MILYFKNLGFLPINSIEAKDTIKNDPYFNIAKTNHVLNYLIRIPRYQGYVPTNPQNIKGVIRPECLSTNGEKFS